MDNKKLKSHIYKKLDELDEQGLDLVNEIVSDYLNNTSVKSSPENPSEWQKTRMDESSQQINDGKSFSNEEADQLVEKWLSE